jgi:hypothetical protein
VKRSSLVLICLALASCGGSEEPSACARYCLAVSPAAGDTKTIFTIRGRHWKPDSTVTAEFGVYCPPDHACVAISFGRILRTDPSGAFTLEFRSGPAPLRLRGVEGRHSVGGGPVEFVQRIGAGRRVRRTAHLTVNGVRY